MSLDPNALNLQIKSQLEQLEVLSLCPKLWRREVNGKWGSFGGFGRGISSCTPFKNRGGVPRTWLGWAVGMARWHCHITWLCLRNGIPARYRLFGPRHPPSGRR